MQLFYNPNINETSESFSFDKEESKHIIKVLRKKDTDILYVTNGLGFLFKTEITLASDNKCTVKIISFEKEASPKFQLHLAVAPTKMNDRFEWFLEKATEIGVSEIIPLLCSRTEKQVIKNDRLENILISAMLQSRQVWKPVLTSPKKIKELISQQSETIKLIAHCELDEKKNELTIVAEKKDTLILIGPEGDFTGEEISEALKNNFIPVALGDTRLRTETAGMVAATLLCIQR
jgi:16S rRNA (uracil1498-N3)-methyltransferase